MLKYFLTELKHQLLNPAAIFFVVIMPISMFLIFGGQAELSEKLPSGVNISGLIAIQMGFYGAILASSQAGADIGQMRESGWLRTLHLNGMNDSRYTLIRLALSYAVVVPQLVLLYTVAAFTFADMPLKIWAYSAVMTILLGGLYAGVGQIFGAFLPANAANGLASGFVVLGSFLSDMFMPLTGTMYKVGQFMPFFGTKTLVAWQATQGKGTLGNELNLTYLTLNVVIWLGIITFLSWWTLRFTRTRS
ncbi:hypothetical protein BSR28_04905 [Boudabousia liubingyangii]|uniref:hypothetical protein n=1 Tax=Boudabousia liubingyangii TaxID=1921764 RepID=UPI00093CC841|nr:hypothetical protein [Boudabousia liubingyangii]OKL46782.1 hypothetical protein BSR28_04905 [Boudabousia liubingyangii]